MQLETKEIETIAKKLNLSKEEMIRESLMTFLEKKLKEISIEIYKIRTKYGVSSVLEFEQLYKDDKIKEEDTWQDLQKLDHLEFKKEELEKTLKNI